jgi:hypothetical protein
MRSRRIPQALLLVVIPAMAFTSVLAETPPAENFVAHLSGDQEIPLRESSAVGQAIFRLHDDGSALSYRLIATNIDNIVASHIHIAPLGVNGPVVAFLAGPFPAADGRHNGILAEGTIRAANLVGPLAGMDFSLLVAALRTGGAYVNVHTNDGIDPTNEGPGDFPGGEIRGQIRTAGPAE